MAAISLLKYWDIKPVLVNAAAQLSHGQPDSSAGKSQKVNCVTISLDKRRMSLEK